MEETNKYPSSWEVVAFADLFLDPKNQIVDGPFGSNLKADEYKENGIPILRIQNIDRNKFIDKNIKYVSNEKAESLSRHSFISGDIIITKLGIPVGKACFVPLKFPKGIIVADLVRARVTHDFVDKKFLLYQINSNEVIKQFEKYTKGTTRPRVNLQIIRDLEIVLPPLNEQHRIVDKIEELFSELDHGVANLKLAQRQLKVYRQALLKHAFEGKLTEQWRQENNPEPAEKLLERIQAERQNRYEQEVKDWKAAVKDWEKGGQKGGKPGKPKLYQVDYEVNTQSSLGEKKLSRLPNSWLETRLEAIALIITDGDHQAPPKADRGIPFITISNIKNNVIDFSNTFHVEPNYYRSLPEYRKPIKGDVLYTVTGSFGIPVIIDFDFCFCFQRHIGLIRPLSLVNSRWLFYLMQSRNVYSQAAEMATGTAQKTVGLNSLRSIAISICNKEEQEIIVSSLDSQMSIIGNLEATINSALQKSEALRQAILKKAFEGKLVPQDPTDEPASELLKRIQAEKKAYLEAEKQGKKRKPAERGLSRNTPVKP